MRVDLEIETLTLYIHCGSVFFFFLKSITKVDGFLMRLMLDFSIKIEFLVLAPIIIYRNRAAICVCIYRM